MSTPCLHPIRGDILVEHDVTFDLYRQVRDRARQRSLAQRWDYWRWRRFEMKWLRRYRKVVVMSERDAALLDSPNVAVIPNGVDLARFAPEIERPGERLLFIGSFRHFPNIVAYRFFVEQVWPMLRQSSAEIKVTVVAGPDPLLYWREHTGLLSIPTGDRIQLLDFVADVRPLYVEANLVLVPTLVSAGTNLKVLEGMAMERAIVSTSSGCAGLGLEHGVNVWIADTAADFALAIRTLLGNRDLRQRIAAAGREHVERHFDWKEIGQRQRALLWRSDAASRSDPKSGAWRFGADFGHPGHCVRGFAVAASRLSGLRLRSRAASRRRRGLHSFATSRR